MDSKQTSTFWEIFEAVDVFRYGTLLAILFAILEICWAGFLWEQFNTPPAINNVYIWMATSIDALISTVFSLDRYKYLSQPVRCFPFLN